MRIIIDCNIWISFLLGFQKDVMKQVLQSQHIDVFVCPQLLREIADVATRPKIRNRITDVDLENLLHIIRTYCQSVTITHNAQSGIRDAKDLYLLSLAETMNADYIVSGDSDLLVLESHQNTRIVAMSEFRNVLLGLS